MHIRGFLAAVALLVATGPATQPPASPPTRTAVVASSRYLQFVITSDLHYGITRRAFRGDTNVRAARVNSALIAQIDAVSSLVLPRDLGVRAEQRVGAIDFVAITGDIANRADDGVQRAAVSWSEFREGFLDALTLRDGSGRKSAVLMVPGNHDLSNAIGAEKIADSARDATSAMEMYNRMLHPAELRTTATYQYPRDHIHFSVDQGNVHLAFLNLWPDSVERAWLEHDLARVPTNRPVLLFAHDPPNVDPRHFINPNGAHDINAKDRFENLLSDQYRDARAIPEAGLTTGGDGAKSATDVEQRDFVTFLRRHANIKAYFHGHSNFHEFYDYRGPDGDVKLPTFRIDSPMKGARSAADETQLSFELVTIDTQTRRMTVRECLWNVERGRVGTPIRFGASRTISLR